VAVLLATIGAVSPSAILVSDVSAQTYPGYAFSHYVTSTSTTAAYNEGCALADDPTLVHDAVVILDFGPAARQTGTSTTYGALIWDANRTYRTTTQIRDIARQFGRGYYLCANSPFTSQLRVAIGVSSDSVIFDGPHGTAWGNMVDDVQSWYVTNHYSSQVSASGAADIELGFNATYTMAKAWGDAFSTASSGFYYNFGDAAGCSLTSSSNGACNNGWNQQKIWTVSWGVAAAGAIPEIYSTTVRTTPNTGKNTNANALEWQMISLYGVLHQGGRQLIYAGSLTQNKACAQVGCASGTNASPANGWTYFYNALNDDTRTDQSLFWASDIMWGY
jgi:hypothetical protein